MNKVFGRLYINILIVVFFATSCQKEKSYSNIPLDSLFMLRVEQQVGDNIDPFSQEALGFIGFPGCISYNEEMPSFPFLLIGKDLDRKDKYMSHYIASVELQLESGTKYMGIAFPVNEKYRTTNIVKYEDFSSEHANVKLWLTDWFTFAYRSKGLKSVIWKNEVDILRKFVKEIDN